CSRASSSWSSMPKPQGCLALPCHRSCSRALTRSSNDLLGALLLQMLRSGIGRFCCKSLNRTTEAHTLRLHLKCHFLRWRPQECDSSNEIDWNQDSILGGTANVNQGAERLLQQIRHEPTVAC